MHEFSICQNIVDIVISEYNKISPKPARLLKVNIRVGRLHQIITESLEMAYEVLTKDTVAENSALVIHFQEIRCLCRQCKWEGSIDYPFFICKQCNTGEITVTSGKELYLENLEVEYDEATKH